jgi:hypothetical protein
MNLGVVYRVERLNGMLSIVLAVAMLGAAAPAVAAPCLRPAACTEWVALGHGGARSLVYRSFPLTIHNERIRRVLIIVHGAERQAAAHFDVGLAAARLEGALDDTLVIAPRFASRDSVTCDDVLARDELNWPCDGNSWRSGGAARGSRLTSFDFADEILRLVSNRSTFPNLRSIVLSGHSAGGQFVTRYQMANRVHDTLGVTISYVVANPSSYAYPEPVRPVLAKGRFEFRPFDARTCATFDWWPYGLRDREGYTQNTDVAVLKRQLTERPATYLLGEDDVFPVALFDGSCAAMAQGQSRLARGRAFAAYVNEHLGGHHTVTVVPMCGHDVGCMFTANAALPVLFPKYDAR